MSEKRCSKCKKIKTIDNFRKRTATCKKCKSVIDKKRWLEVRSKQKRAVTKEDIEMVRKLKYSLNNPDLLKDELIQLFGAKTILDEFKESRYISNEAQRIALLKHGESLCTKCGHVKKVEEFRVYVLKGSIKCKKCDSVHRNLEKSLLSDSYVKSNIIGDSGLEYDDIPQELVRAKRLELRMKRKIKGE